MKTHQVFDGQVTDYCIQRLKGGTGSFGCKCLPALILIATRPDTIGIIRVSTDDGQQLFFGEPAELLKKFISFFFVSGLEIGVAGHKMNLKNNLISSPGFPPVAGK